MFLQNAVAAAATQLAAATPDISPNNSLPGVDDFARLGGGLMMYALILATVCFFGGIATSLVSSRMNSHGGAVAGKVVTFSSLFVAFAVGSAPAWIAFAQKIGDQIN